MEMGQVAVMGDGWEGKSLVAKESPDWLAIGSVGVLEGEGPVSGVKGPEETMVSVGGGGAMPEQEVIIG